LWFSNKNDLTANTILEDVVREIASFKFIPIAYQISSRLSSAINIGKFETIIRKFVFQMAADHPHHLLPILFALSLGGEVGEVPGAEEYQTNVKFDYS